jgi:hypothetical protein
MEPPTAGNDILRVLQTVDELPAPVRHMLIRTTPEGARQLASNTKCLDLQLDDGHNLNMQHVFRRFTSIKTMYLRKSSQLERLRNVQLPEGLQLFVYIHNTDASIEAIELFNDRPDVAAAVRVVDTLCIRIGLETRHMFMTVLNMPVLKTLRLRNTFVGKTSFEVPVAPQLANLQLICMDVSAHTIRQIAERAPNVTKLEIEPAYHGNVYGNLSALTRLEELIITRDYIKNVVLPASVTTLTLKFYPNSELSVMMSTLNMNNGVRKLVISDSKSLKSVAQATTFLPALQTLDVRGCRSLSAEVIEAARAVIPEVLF